MQDDFDAIYSQRKRKQDDEDEFDAIYRPKPPVESERPNAVVRSAQALGQIARHPVDAAVSIGKGLLGNAKDLIGMSQMAHGNMEMYTNAIRDEYEKGGDDAEIAKRLKLRALGAASLAVPTLRVGGAATSFLANTAANAGLGAAQTPDDPTVGAILGAVVPHAIPKVGSMARKATEALARRVTPLMDLNLSGATSDVLAGVDEGMRNTVPKRRVAGKGNPELQGPRRAPERITVDDLADSPLDRILAERTPRQNAGFDAHTVRPVDPAAPIGAAFPEGFRTEANAPEPEVVTGGLDTNGRRIVVTNPEVKANRVADERIDNAEQRDAENRMVKEAREMAAEKEAAARDAERASKEADKQTQALQREQERAAAKVAAEADKAARIAEKAAKAAAVAQQRQSDNAAKEAAKAAGTMKEYAAQQRAAKAERLAADAKEKAALAAQAAQDAAAKKLAAEAIVESHVSAPEAPAPETAQGILQVANAKFSEQKRRALSAQAVLARRRGVEQKAAQRTDVQALADEYNASRPDFRDDLPRVQAVDPEFGKRVADWYEGAQSNPADPATIAAYRALADETRAQAEFLRSKGVRFEYVTEDPYPNSAAMMKDVQENGRLKVFKTPDDFNHPILSAEENDLFRAIHDFFGHAKEGHQFGPKGEENAYRVHSAMFSEEARKAMATETRGQNSWVNFGPHGESNRANPKETRFAEQKTVLMPDELRGDYGAPPQNTPAEPLGAPLTDSNPPGIPEVGQTPVHTLQPADKPFLNWRTLGVDPSKPDALSMSAAARVQAAASRPEMVERLAAERGKTTFAAMSEEAKKTWAIDQLGVDRLAVDGKKLVGLTGAQIHELKAPLLENAGLMEGIARELPNLMGDELAHAQRVFEGLERSNDEILAAIQREGSARGRDLGALRQVAMVTTDPAVWLVKAKQALGDRPMTADIQAKIMKLAQEAAEACGGG